MRLFLPSLPGSSLRYCDLRSCSLSFSIASLLAGGLVAQRLPKPTSAPQDPPSTKPQAQEPTGPVRMPEVLIQESEFVDERLLEDVPLDYGGARDLIGPRTMQRSGGLNIQEALRRSPGIHIQEETGSDSLPNIALRGVTNGAEGAWRSINLGMYVDGIPLAPAPYGQPGNSLFPLTLERVYAVDVQRGGGAVRYGPNNVAGVVNFLTRPIPIDPTAYARVRIDTFDNASYYGAVGGTTGPVGVLVEGVYKQGESWRDNGDYTIQNYSLKTSYRLSDSLRLLGQVETFDDETNLADGLTYDAYLRNPKQTLSPQNRFSGQQDRANIRLEWDVTDRTLFEVITYWFDGTRTFYLGSPVFYGNNAPSFIQATPRPIRTFAVQPQVTHRYDLGNADGELHIGLRYLQEDTVRSVRRFLANGSEQLRSEEQYDYYTGSAWIENRLHMGDWTVTPGLRFEYVEIDGRNRFNQNQELRGLSVEKDFTEVLPGLTLSRLLNEHWSVYGGAQRTFAAPQAPQISITRNPQDISAQYAWVYELGTRARTADRLLGADLTFYHIDYRDRLVPDPDQFDVFVNAGDSRHRGVELALETDLEAAGLSGLSAWSSTSWNDSKFTNGEFDGNRFAGAPRWLLSWGTRYDHVATGLWASIDGAYVGPAFTDAANTRDISADGTRGLRPSYSLWNASIGWDHKFGDDTELSLMLGGRNVFDEEYFEPRTARGIFPGAPASMLFQVGVTHRF
jgi:Fe(3+) dicitrate transport protein